MDIASRWRPTVLRSAAASTIQVFWRAHFEHLTKAATRISIFFRNCISLRLEKVQRERAARSIQKAIRLRSSNSAIVYYRKSLREVRDENIALKVTLGELREVDNSWMVCPITLQRIKDPVLNSVDCHFYESEAIETWLRSSNQSPLTRQACAPHHLYSLSNIGRILHDWTTKKRGILLKLRVLCADITIRCRHCNREFHCHQYEHFLNFVRARIQHEEDTHNSSRINQDALVREVSDYFY